MADAQTFPSYNLAMAGLYPDPTQWSNPYSNYQTGALPFPPGYSGTPTNAMGQPIPGYQAPSQQAAPSMGTTLNSSPNSQWALNNSMLQDMMSQGGASQPNRMSGSGTPPSSLITQMQQNNAAYGVPTQGYGPQQAARLQSMANAGIAEPGFQAMGQGGAGSQNVAPQAPQPASAYGSWQNAINALSNPGNPSAVGAPYQQMSTNPMNAMGQGINQAALNRFQQGGIGQQAQPGIGGGSSGVSFGANNAFFNNLKGAQ